MQCFHWELYNVATGGSQTYVIHETDLKNEIETFHYTKLQDRAELFNDSALSSRFLNAFYHIIFSFVPAIAIKEGLFNTNSSQDFTNNSSVKRSID